MKKFLTRRLLLLSIFYVIVSCNKEDEKPEPATVGFEITSASSDENAGDKSVKVVLGKAAEKDAVIQLSFSGTATKDADYTVPGSSVTIPAGQTSAVLNYAIVHDNEFEATAENIVIKIESASNGIVVDVEKSTFTHTIEGENPSIVSFKVKTAESGETGEELTAVIELSAALKSISTIKFATSGTTTKDEDYTVLTANPISIPAGQTTAEIKYKIIADGKFESNAETLIIKLTDPTGGLQLHSSESEVTFTHTIKAEDPSIAAFKVKAAQSGETNEELTAVIELGKALPNTSTIRFVTSGTATKDVDYTILTASPISIPAGQTTAEIKYKIIADGNYEANAETLIIKLAEPTDGVQLNANEADITFTHTVSADPEPTFVNFKTTSATGSEDAGIVNVTVELSKALTSDASITFTTSGLAAVDKDYKITASPLVIPAGSTSADIQLQIVNDPMIELRDEDIKITLTGGDNGIALGSKKEYVYTVRDDDQPSAASETGMMIDITWSTGFTDTNIDMTLMRESGGISVSVGFGTNTDDFEHYLFANSWSDATYYVTVEHNSGIKDTDFSVVVTKSDGTRQTFFGTFTPSGSSNKYDFIKIVKAGSSITVSK